jgi:riboflavin kinase / FMN adenylyltransferase
VNTNPVNTGKQMKLLSSPTELQSGIRKVCLAIGMFDGVHLGHQQVIRQAIADAEQQEAFSVVVTFDRHPNAVVAPTRVPPLIYTLSQKLRVIESMGVSATWLIPFDENFSQKSGETFIRELAHDFGQIHSICVGSSFTFGHKRSGNVPLLERMGTELGFVTHGLAALSLDGQVVSSTRIRDAIRSGQLDAATQMLGRGYSLSGKVVLGDQLGRKLGFPTANLDVTGLVTPPTAVYAVHAQVLGRNYRGAANIGYRPTLQNPTPQLRVEVHLLDFDGDLYGQEMELTFVSKIRDEQKFPSLETLKEQIQKDIVSARQRFA